MAVIQIAKNAARTRQSARKAGIDIEQGDKRPKQPVIEQEQPDIM
jgi:hypothetical protein